MSTPEQWRVSSGDARHVSELECCWRRHDVYSTAATDLVVAVLHVRA